MPNVIDTIVSADLCIGCGICAVACPKENLTIITNRTGEYNASLKRDCIRECGACLNYCPFSSEIPNEDEIGKSLFAETPGMHHDPALGYIVSSFLGHVTSDEGRERAASGGLATWLLSTMLQKGIIDAAICVAPSRDRDMRFEYSIIRDVGTLRSCSGSVYYPVHLSDVLSHVLHVPGRYAITTLPCFAKGIRLAQMKNHVLKERIAFVFGLTCGQMKSKHYTDYLLALSGISGDVTSVRYRAKDRDHAADDYHFTCENQDGEVRNLYWHDRLSLPWSDRWFTLNPCDFCDDIFAETADATFMDAWLPEHTSDWRGTSIVVVRDHRILQLLNEGGEKGDISIDHVPVDKVRSSQAGVILYKRRDLGYRLWLANGNKTKVPKKRVEARVEPSFFRRKKAEMLRMSQLSSKVLFLRAQDEHGFKLASFMKEMAPHQRRLRMVRAIDRMTRIPQHVMRRSRRHL